MRQFPKFMVCLFICFGSAAIGGFFTASSVDSWYAQLAKPEFNPPAWVFAPVWNVLYFLMAVALYRIWTSANRPDKKTALAVFFGQLLLNVAWSAVFFGLRSPAGGFLVIILLLLGIICTINYFRRVSRLSAWLLVPYLAWVLFAACLNYYLWQLNG